jgi:hypothetical protein
MRSPWSWFICVYIYLKRSGIYRRCFAAAVRGMVDVCMYYSICLLGGVGRGRIPSFCFGGNGRRIRPYMRERISAMACEEEA